MLPWDNNYKGHLQKEVGVKMLLISCKYTLRRRGIPFKRVPGPVSCKGSFCHKYTSLIAAKDKLLITFAAISPNAPSHNTASIHIGNFMWRYLGLQISKLEDSKEVNNPVYREAH